MTKLKVVLMKCCLGQYQSIKLATWIYYPMFLPWS